VPRTAAVLPVKRFSAAKQRLHPPYSPAQRRALAEAMVGDVLAALAAVGDLEATIVVSGEPVACELADAQGALVVRDEADAGQSAAAVLGIARAREAGFERVLLVPGDCPALDPAEVTALLGHPEPVVIVPDRHGTGTNALALSPPGVIEPAFGPGSRERHERLAAQANVGHRVAALPSLGLDVDTDGALRALAAALAARAGGAPRTRAALGRLEPAPAA
jgi:2-phospho-L-lactate guanylyltransferase